LVVVGPQPAAALADGDAVFELARRLGYPVLAEATSQLRFGSAPHGVVRIAALELVLRLSRTSSAHRPDIVVQLGGTPTSAAYGELAASGVPRIIVSPHAWNDPWSSAEEIVTCDVAPFARAVSSLVAARNRGAWLAAYSTADALASRTLAAELESEG